MSETEEGDERRGDALWWCRTCGGAIRAGDVDIAEIRDGGWRLVKELTTHLALDGHHEVVDLNRDGEE